MDTYYKTNLDIMEWNQIYMPQGNMEKKMAVVENAEEERERNRELAVRRRKRMLREKRRKRRKIRRLIRVGIRLGVLLVILTAGCSFLIKKVNGLLGDGMAVSKPYYHEVQEMSAASVRKTDVYRSVSEHPERYPANMAEKLENNPELIDFVEHYPEYEPVARGGISKAEKEEKYPLFLQWDQRWGYASYGDDNIGFSGCGPTCLSMVIFSLTRDANATPNVIGNFAMDEGYYVYGTGTSWDLMTAAAAAYGVNASAMGMDETIMKDSLDAGQLIIASMGPGDFTSSGHFIVIYGYNDEGFFVNDPNSKKRSNQVWSFQTLNWQIRNMWVYYR